MAISVSFISLRRFSLIGYIQIKNNEKSVSTNGTGEMNIFKTKATLSGWVQHPFGQSM
jgi:hypothetical protein